MKNKAHTYQLPKPLDKQFSDLKWRLLKVFTFQKVTVNIGSLISIFLVIWISDRFWETPFAWRMGLWIAFFFIAYTQWVIFNKHGLKQGSSPMRMARTVQRRFKRLGSRLSGILELSNPEKRPPGYSSELYQAAIHQVADEASSYDFNESVAVTNRLNFARIVLFGAGLVIFLAILFPESVLPTFKRMVVPWGATPRFSMVELNSIPNAIYVPHGEPFSLKGQVKYHSFWRPKDLRYSIQGAFDKNLVFQGSQYSVDVSGCIEPCNLKLEIGDTYHFVRITPVHRPGLESVETSIQLPSYLGYDEQFQSSLSGNLSLLNGSKIKMSGFLSRDLKGAEVSFSSKSGQWDSLSIQTNMFETEIIDVVDKESITFRWRDTYGFRGDSPWQLHLETYSDSAPTLQLKEIVPQGAYLETEIIPAIVAAMDDFGVAETGVQWKHIQEESPDESTNKKSSDIKGTFTRETGQFNSIAVEENFGFSPKLLGIPADSIVEVRGYAKDHMPNRDPVFTEPVRVLIVSVDRHAELLRQNLENILTQAEDVLRAEENISELNKMTLEDLNLDASMESVKDQIEANADLQEMNAQNMERLAEMGQQILREAMRNPSFQPEAIQDWNETLQKMQSVSQNQMPQASNQMANASNQKSSEEAQEDLEKAQEMIEEILDELSDLQEDINQGLDELQAMTLAQRLRALGQKQVEIIEIIKKSVARTIGLTIDELSNKFIQQNEFAAEDQTLLAGSADELFQEISRFAERTELEPYQKVTEEINDVRPVDSLKSISGKINQNVLAQSMSLQSNWAEQFEEWAKSLEPEPKDNDGGGEGDQEGGDQQQQDNALMEMMIKLLRMREKEIDIQKQTRLLNEGSDIDVNESAGRLSNEQLDLLADMDVLTQSNPLLSLTPVLKETMDLMNQVSTLLGEPRVDVVTDGKQTETVYALTDAINIINEAANNQSPQQQQQQQQQQTTAQQMAFLMQMMSQAPVPGQLPGTQGNPNGGSDLDQVSDNNNKGDVTGDNAQERRSERASGSLSEMPAEFQPMLEEYFKLLEKIEK